MISNIREKSRWSERRIKGSENVKWQSEKVKRESKARKMEREN